MPVNWTVTCEHEGQQFTSTCEYLVIATGHHAKPKIPKFSGEENFKGEIIHSVKYKDVRRSGYDNKKVVLIGIGNSSVDIADNLVSKGGCPVEISTRSGAWVFNNYTFGQPSDLGFNRMTVKKTGGKKNVLASAFLRSLITILQGHPNRWGLNPKYDPADTHPTVSPTLIHHIQRGNVTIKPDIQEIGEDFVKFTDGSISNDVDVIIKCTGYTIHLPYMEETTRNMILNEETNDLKMYHTVFHPDIGPSLAMIGYIQPIGSLIAISEIQAQWLGQVIAGGCSLPPKLEMKERIIKDKQEQANYKVSTRHTIQRHPLLYCDELASYFGAKPSIRDFPQLAPRLLFSSCGAAQWTLKGPYRHNKAAELVCKTPVPAFNVIGYVSINAMVLLLLYLSIKVLFFIFGFLF